MALDLQLEQDPQLVQLLDLPVVQHRDQHLDQHLDLPLARHQDLQVVLHRDLLLQAEEVDQVEVEAADVNAVAEEGAEDNHTVHL